MSYLKRNWQFLSFFPIPFIFYWYTCLPSIGLNDSIRFINDIKHLTISTHVNQHNLTTILGWVVQFLPFEDIAYKANLSCVIAGGFAVSIFYYTIYITHGCWITALISSLFLMMSHSMWWYSTFIFEFAINALLATISLYLYAQLQRTNQEKYLYALFSLASLALFQHYLLGSLLIGATATLLWRITKQRNHIWPVLWKSAFFFLIGLLPWILTFIHDISIAHGIHNAFSDALFGKSGKRDYFAQPLWDGLTAFLFLLFLQFPSPYILTILSGPYFFLKKWKLSANSLGIILTVIPTTVFVLGFTVAMYHLNADYLTVFVVLIFWASFVIHKIVHHPRVLQSTPLRYALMALAIISLIWPVYFYAHLSQWGENPSSIWSSYFKNRTYNSYRLNEFEANPNKHNYNDISEFCTLALQKLPPHAEFWNSDELALQFGYYQKYYPQRLDLDMVNISSFGNANIDSYNQKIKYAYLNNKDLFFCSMLDPEISFLSKLPDKKDYKFKEFYLNDNKWVYKLITINEKNSKLTEKELWHRWDMLPVNTHILINVTPDNVLSFQEGGIFYQQDFGPPWVNNDQIYFNPHKEGDEIGFMLKFPEAFKGNLSLAFTTAHDAGIIQILLNNEPLGNPIDLYTITTAIKKVNLQSIAFEKGNNILSIKAIGKNVASIALGFGVDTIEINSQ